jgi:hypothetical protein
LQREIPLHNHLPAGLTASRTGENPLLVSIATGLPEIWDEAELWIYDFVFIPQ